MRLRKHLNLSDLSLAAAVVVGSYVLANAYIIKRTLPANACRYRASINGSIWQ
ncbi:MAG: hypothetical protein GX918_03220 [Clostridiales bacterium]|jgi:hypothetical protein|nr:hypothetical protein [Clostridiales bacterium]